MYIIGVDIGASNMKFVLMDKIHPVKSSKTGILLGAKLFNRASVLKKRKIATPKIKKELISALKNNIKEIAKNVGISKVSGIGIGVSGPIDRKSCRVVSPPNLLILKNCEICKILYKDFKTKIKIENDANCFAFAEAIMGVGKNANIVLGITLGSGVGGGLVFEKKIYHGAFGSAGEVGHMAINFDGLKCGCGNIGCFEAYASKQYINAKTKISVEEIDKLAKKGNKVAREIWEDFGKNLGIGIANLVNILDPEVIVIGGGFSKAGELILKSAREEAKKRILSPLSRKNVKIKKSQLGDFAGAIGAAIMIVKSSK
jgi:glucokinase